MNDIKSNVEVESVYSSIGPFVAPTEETFYRLTEDGDIRILEDNYTRILE